MSEDSAPTELPGWMTDHIDLYKDDPDKGHDWDSSAIGDAGVLPCLLLTTRGRKSGQPRVSPLIYIKVDTGYAVIASKGGAPTHPAWYLNLAAQPACKITVRRDQHGVTARTTKGEERETIWKQMAEIYPPYNDYQAATDRAIPVVVLEPSA